MKVVLLVFLAAVYFIYFNLLSFCRFLTLQNTEADDGDKEMY